MCFNVVVWSLFIVYFLICPNQALLLIICWYYCCIVVYMKFFQGFDEAEIQKKVGEYRKLLQSQVESGELDIDAEMDNRDTHVRAKAAMQGRSRMRAALGIKDDFVDGTSFEKFVFPFHVRNFVTS